MTRLAIGLLSLFAVNGMANAGVVYQLDNGSTLIYLPTGQTYDLTGSFTWEVLDPPTPTFASFTESALNFVGGPVSISLHTASPQTQSSDTFFPPAAQCSSGVCASFFGAVVDINVSGVGIFLNYNFANLEAGTYSGDYTSPTHVSYTNLFGAPETGGASLVKLNFGATAIGVPEPSTMGLLLVALVTAGIGRQRRRSRIRL